MREYFEEDFPYLDIHDMHLELREIQGTHEEIVIDKAKTAMKLMDYPILVEDSSLEIKSYGGMPGPYIKEFIQQLKPEGVYKMAAAYEDRTAIARCTFCLNLDKYLKVHKFTGEVEGIPLL